MALSVRSWSSGGRGTPSDGWFWSYPLTITLVAVLAMSFPSGRLPVGRWRRPAVLLVGAMAAITLAGAVWPVVEVFPDGISKEPFRMPNPPRLLPADVLGSATDAFSGVAGPVLFALLIMSIASVLTSVCIRAVDAGGTAK